MQAALVSSERPSCRYRLREPVLVESGTDELLDYDRIREADQRLLFTRPQCLPAASRIALCGSRHDDKSVQSFQKMMSK